MKKPISADANLDLDALDAVAGGRAVYAPVPHQQTQSSQFGFADPQAMYGAPASPFGDLVQMSREANAYVNQTHRAVAATANSTFAADQLADRTQGAIVFHENGDGRITAEDFLRNGRVVSEANAARTVGSILDQLTPRTTAAQTTARPAAQQQAQNPMSQLSSLLGQFNQMLGQGQRAGGQQQQQRAGGQQNAGQSRSPVGGNEGNEGNDRAPAGLGERDAGDERTGRPSGPVDSNDPGGTYTMRDDGRYYRDGDGLPGGYAPGAYTPADAARYAPGAVTSEPLPPVPGYGADGFPRGPGSEVAASYANPDTRAADDRFGPAPEPQYGPTQENFGAFGEPRLTGAGSEVAASYSNPDTRAADERFAPAPEAAPEPTASIPEGFTPDNEGVYSNDAGDVFT